jgi:hypothetical protein
MHEFSKKSRLCTRLPRVFLLWCSKSRLGTREGGMRIEFPKEEEDFSPQDVYIAYKHLVDYHLHFLELQSKCEFFYWKLMGIFFLSILGASILWGEGIIIDPSIAIAIVGLGCLSVFIQNAKMDLEYGAGAASCVERGILIEKKYGCAALFRVFEDNKNLVYRGNLLSREVPFTFIGLITLVAGIIWAEKIGMWLAIAVALLFIIGFGALVKFYIKAARRAILGVGR